MTHVEFFHYPVWEKDFSSVKEIIKKKREQLQPVLFDYKERNLITKDCRFVKLPELVQQGSKG